MKGQTKPDAFAALLVAQRALYDAEIARLVEAYRTRILAGEFCGSDIEEGGRWGCPRYLNLEKEIEKTHPWLATQQGRLVVVSASRWLATGEVTGENGSVENELGDCASECMARDILAVAAARKWIKPETNENDEFELRVG